MSKYQITPAERKHLEEGANIDRPQLFALADQVITQASERQWDAVISDAARGILVGRFLTQVLSVEAHERDQRAPELVHISNSRAMYFGILFNGLSEPSHGHSQAITNHLRPKGFERALIASDIVDTGKCLRKLGAAVIKADITPDFAILASSHEPATLRRKIHASRRSEVYAIKSSSEPILAESAVRQGLGLETIYGIAEPQPSADAWPWIGEVAYKLYDRLADEYIQEHII